LRERIASDAFRNMLGIEPVYDVIRIWTGMNEDGSAIRKDENKWARRVMDIIV